MPYRIHLKTFASVLCSALFLFLTACGEDTGKDDIDPAQNFCADVICSLGVCDAATGTCVNPEQCTKEVNCLDGFTCDGGVCIEAAPCDNVTCDRGVCDVATGECVNAQFCDAETQQEDCLDGFACFGQECVDEPTFCSEFVCDRGVCDFDIQGCGNAESCSSDMECVEGFLCNGGTCIENRCDADMVSCERGICDPVDGACINAESCSELSECTDGFWCLAGSCQAEDDACGGCLGNQVCEYDEPSLSAACGENPAGCRTSNDCLDARACRDASCGEPGACALDQWEPNEDVAGAVDIFAERLTDARIEATLCTGDVDVFSYDVTQNPLFTGTLFADVQFLTEDIGLGELDIRLLDSTGAEVAAGTTTDGSGRVSFQVGVLDQETFFVEISGASGLSTAGVRYGVFVDLVDQTVVDACAAAPELSSTNTGNALSGDSAALAPSCALDADAGEDIWRFTLDEAQVVTLELTPDSDADMVLSLRRDCEIDSSEVVCINDNGAASGESIQGRLEAGTYFVVVQGAGANSGGPYTLTYEAVTPICSSQDDSCIDMSTARVCNSLGTMFEEVTCEAGCDPMIGRCTRQEGDVCDDAFDASSGFTGSVDLNLFQNDYSPGSTCVPAGSGLSATAGPDATFRVDLPDAHALEVSTSTQGFDDLSIYILRDCADVANSCFGGVNDAGGTESLAYTNSSVQAETLYVVVDSSDSFSYDIADVEIQTGPVICTPGSAICMGSTLEVCSPAGLSNSPTSCNYGCDSMAGACNPPPHDVCGAGAIDVGTGGTFTGNLDEFADDYNPTTSGCTGFSASGGDAVYEVTGTAGDVVTATLTSTFDSSLYAVTDCADIVGTCVAGSDGIGSSATETIKFVLRDTNPVNIIVDGFSSVASGTYTLDVTVETPDCFNPGGVIGCQDIDNLSYCDEFGFTQTYACTAGCAAGTCGSPTADVCIDPIVLTDGSSFSGNFSDYSAELDPGAGTCIYSDVIEQDGPDAVFAIDLAAGQTLEAELTTPSSNAGMYVLDSCADVNASCRWAEPQSKSLDFFAESTGRYFLVVDSTDTVESQPFTLDVSITFGDVCQPGGATCDEQTGTLTRCSDDGSTVQGTVTCPSGCSGQFCLAPSPINDTCAAAQTVTGAISIFDNFARFSDDYDPGSMGCLGEAAPGRDSVYEVTLGPNEAVLVDVQANDPFDRPAVYFTSDCTDVSMSCLGGAIADARENRVSTGYLSQAGETVNVIVDASSSFDDGTFILDIETQQAECTPGTTLCADADTLQTCADYGVFKDQECFFGCTAGACNAPPNDMCAGAIDANGGGDFAAPIEEYTNDYDPTATGCTGYDAVGNDAAYVFTPQLGDVVRASVSAAFDAVIYAVTDCSMVQSTCQAGADNTVGGTEGIIFTAQAAVPHYIIVDQFDPQETGVFDLNIDYGPPVCEADSSVCGDGTTLDICDSAGISYDDTYTCANSCTIGDSICSGGDGDICFEAIDANATGTFSGNFANVANDYSPIFGGACTGFDAVGPDRAYVVDLMANQTLTATLTAADSSQDTSLYIVSSCSGNIESNCLGGSDISGTGETATYTATSDERVFVIADNYDSSAFIPVPSNYDLVIQVQ